MPITPEFALKLGFAAGKVLKRTNPKAKPLVVLVKIHVYRLYFRSSFTSRFKCSRGVCTFIGPLPTPAIAHLTRALHAHAGL
jgi:phosphoglucosamine mutase